VWTLTAATASVTRRCACDRQSARVPSHPSSATTTATQLQASGTYVCSCCSWPGPRHGALLVSRSVAPSCREQRDAVAPPSHCLTVHRARDEMDPVSKATQIGKYGYSGHILNVRANSKHACQHGTGTVGTAADQVDDADRCPTFGARKNEKGTVIWADGKNVYTTLISSSGQPSSGISKKGIEKVMVAQRDGVKTVFLGEASIAKKIASTAKWNSQSITPMQPDAQRDLPIRTLRSHAKALGILIEGQVQDHQTLLNAVLAEEGAVVSGNVLEELHCENSELGALLDLDEHSYGREKPFDQLLCYGDSNRRLNGSHGIVTLQDALKDDVAAGATVTQVDTAQPGVTVKGMVWKDASAGDTVLIVAVNEPIHGSATKPLLLKSSAQHLEIDELTIGRGDNALELQELKIKSVKAAIATPDGIDFRFFELSVPHPVAHHPEHGLRPDKTLAIAVGRFVRRVATLLCEDLAADLSSEKLTGYELPANITRLDVPPVPVTLDTSPHATFGACVWPFFACDIVVFKDENLSEEYAT